MNETVEINAKLILSVFKKARIELFLPDEITKLRTLQSGFVSTEKEVRDRDYILICHKVREHEKSVAASLGRGEPIGNLETTDVFFNRLNGERKAFKAHAKKMSYDALEIVQTALRRAEKSIAEYAAVLEENESKTFFGLGFKKHEPSPTLLFIKQFPRYVKDLQWVVYGPPKNLFYGVVGELCT